MTGITEHKFFIILMLELNKRQIRTFSYLYRLVFFTTLSRTLPVKIKTSKSNNYQENFRCVLYEIGSERPINQSSNKKSAWGGIFHIIKFFKSHTHVVKYFYVPESQVCLDKFIFSFPDHLKQKKMFMISITINKFN